MDQNTLGDLVFQVKHRTLDYLKAARLNVDLSDVEDIRTTCPLCGRIAHVMTPAPGSPEPSWECMFCDRKGNAVDYAQHYFGLRRNQAIVEVCRKLGVRITKLDTVDAAELMEMELEPQVELIEGMMAPGLYVLAGASKIGKSWLVLQIAHCVSMGLPLWDRKTQRSEVLYLALEDTPRRLRKRLLRVCNGETGLICFATEAEMLGMGFEEQVIDHLRKHEQVKLVIVDTLIKVRAMSSQRNAYADDYATMTSFKRLADRFGVTFLIVHHTRKQEARDIMDMISGTTGLMGCADGALVLERPTRRLPQGSISMTGRDFQDAKMSLRQDPETMCWEFEGYADELTEEPEDPLLSAVGKLAARDGIWKGTAEQLVRVLRETDPKLDIRPNVLTRRLNVMAQELQERYGVLYSRKRNAEGKHLILKSAEAMTDLSDVSDP